MDNNDIERSENEVELKPVFQPSWKRRLFFLLAGILVAMALFWLGLNWLDFVRWLLDKPNMAYDFQPQWSKNVGKLLGYSAWILILLAILFRVIIGKKICPVFFSIGVITAFYVLPFSFFAWKTFGEEIIHRRSFDASVWRNDKSEHFDEWPARLCMVDDLMSSGKLDGLTRNEVVKLLGPPEPNGFPLGGVNSDIHYYLGPERGFIRIDSEWLFITFDDSERVERYWLYRD